MTAQLRQLEAASRLSANQANEEKVRKNQEQLKSKNKNQKKMRNNYEYELGMMTGMNEAIMNQNDKMREKILDQNEKLHEVFFCLVLMFHKVPLVARTRTDIKAAPVSNGRALIVADFSNTSAQCRLIRSMNNLFYFTIKPVQSSCKKLGQICIHFGAFDHV